MMMMSVEEMEDEEANEKVLEAVRELMEEDDGTGERLMWLIERMKWQMSDIIEKKVKTF